VSAAFVCVTTVPPAEKGEASELGSERASSVEAVASAEGAPEQPAVKHSAGRSEPKTKIDLWTIAFIGASLSKQTLNFTTGAAAFRRRVLRPRWATVTRRSERELSLRGLLAFQLCDDR
jgi:hypothetical protein